MTPPGSGNPSGRKGGQYREIEVELASVYVIVYTSLVKTRVFKSGNSLAVRLPKAMNLPCGPVSIRREGRRIVIEEEAAGAWPEGFFEEIRVGRNEFGREVPEYREKRL